MTNIIDANHNGPHKLRRIQQRLFGLAFFVVNSYCFVFLFWFCFLFFSFSVELLITKYKIFNSWTQNNAKLIPHRGTLMHDISLYILTFVYQHPNLYLYIRLYASRTKIWTILVALLCIYRVVKQDLTRPWPLYFIYFIWVCSEWCEVVYRLCSRMAWCVGVAQPRIHVSLFRIRNNM